jgi:hypothetical protein
MRMMTIIRREIDHDGVSSPTKGQLVTRSVIVAFIFGVLMVGLMPIHFPYYSPEKSAVSSTMQA